MSVQRSPCEWDPTLVRVTETVDDPACPAYIHFEKAEEPEVPSPRRRYRLVPTLDRIGRVAYLLVAVPAQSALVEPRTQTAEQLT